METVKYSVDIHAPADHVWYALWNDANYRLWTSVFTEGSYMKGSLSPGSRIHFLRPDGRGMFSDISMLETARVIEFTHLGSVIGLKEVENDPTFKDWAGAKEKYILEETEGKTKLSVSADTAESYVDYMFDKLKEGLDIVKQLSEPLWIRVEVEIELPQTSCWNYFTSAEHIIQWNFASGDWHCPQAEVDLRGSGKFSYRMEAKDGSEGFDLRGIFTEVLAPSTLNYSLEDGRKVKVGFKVHEGKCRILQEFMAENMNAPELQFEGWQSILHNFKKYCEKMKS